MAEKLAFYINRLNFREKFLLLILLALLGVFLAFSLRDDEELDLKQKTVSELKDELSTQNERMKELDEILNNFNSNFKSALDEIYSKAKEQEISFINIQTSSKSNKLSLKHTVLLEFKSSFEQSIAFINSLQKSKNVFLIPNLTMLKEDLSIKTTVKIEFINLM
ncbi:hypothetical protein [uncultured Campylobacter sp.]|uniref:hypothetical protein n=1 Tax=uncultured Campylobacter sp. TaxID=218934 RepID=UPI0026174731|nr:hypothetical protein [uncultured Campylobacter sp.]